MPQPVAVLARDMKKSLGRRRVLRKIDLAVVEGECVVLRGKNGSGKTTLMRCLAGLLQPDAGQIRWFDQETGHTEARALIGLVAHESGLHPHLTLRENLVLWGRLLSLSDANPRAEEWLSTADLRDHGDRRPREVSQGMRRRASIARALLHNPPILLLDEPSAGLDDAGRRWLTELLHDRQDQGSTTIVVTHGDHVVFPPTHRVLELREGRLQAMAPAARSFLSRFSESSTPKVGASR